ncbi:MAG: hypothetical protein IKQ73_09075 [Oscillospiraceae bacterium]|nr:hypothetical protein [Oscillospiraceae bacterium]
MKRRTISITVLIAVLILFMICSVIVLKRPKTYDDYIRKMEESIISEDSFSMDKRSLTDEDLLVVENNITKLSEVFSISRSEYIAETVSSLYEYGVIPNMTIKDAQSKSLVKNGEMAYYAVLTMSDDEQYWCRNEMRWGYILCITKGSADGEIVFCSYE